MSDLEEKTRQLLEQARQLLDKAKETRERANAALREQGIDELPAYLESHMAKLPLALRDQIDQLVLEKERDIPLPVVMHSGAHDERTGMNASTNPATNAAATEPPSKPPRRFRQMV